jgi:hypothetical protein
MLRRAEHTSSHHLAPTDWLSFALALAFGLLSFCVLGVSLDLPALVWDCVVGTGALPLCGTATTSILPLVALLPGIALAFGIVLWRRPVITVWIVFFSATLIESGLPSFSDASTEQIPFWRNLSTSGLAPLPFSPAELLLVFTALAWLAREHLIQTLRVRGSVVLRIYGCYLLMVLVGLVLGTATGGNLNVALWEIRVPIATALIMVLALNLLRSQRQIEVLGWLLLIGSGLKGVQGTWRYVVTLGRNINYNSLLEHEEALFFPAFYLYLLLLFVFHGPRWQKRIGILFLPFVMLADFANQRRASTAGFVIALIALVCILVVILVEQRKRVFIYVLVTLVLLTGYSSVYWNSGSRLAQPIRAIKSQFIPNSRDEGSNYYRELETRALTWQIRANPFMGRGYGFELPLLEGMWDARDIAPFMLYMPHNSVLWVWWRTGILGFGFFWLAVGVAIMRSCMLARATTDPFVRRWAIFAVLVTLMWLILGCLDQGLLLWREVAYVWIVLAVPEVLRRLASSTHTNVHVPGGNTWSK